VTTGKTIVSGVAGRYATAVFELAREEKRLDKVEADLAAIQSVMDESEDFRRLVASPLISREEQGKAVAAVLDRLKVQTVTRNFAGVVVKNGRLDVLPKIITAYNQLLAGERGEVTASVTAPRKLTEKQVKLVSDALAKHAGRAVKIDANVDESLLGGLVVRLGSTMIDTSLKSKLEHLQLAMKEVG
jgi:F-type H+-transporting ATPase subunit delta